MMLLIVTMMMVRMMMTKAKDILVTALTAINCIIIASVILPIKTYSRNHRHCKV